MQKETDNLQESNTMFETIFNAAGDGMYLRDLRDGRLYLANLSCLEMLGYTMEEFRQLDMPDLICEEDLPFVNERFEMIRHDCIGRGGEISFKRKDGSRLPVDIKTSAITLGNQRYALVTFRDITERKHAEVIRQESNALFQTIFDSSADGMCLRDLQDGHFHLANRTCLDMFGYTLEEFKAQGTAEMLSEEMVQFIAEQFEKCRKGGIGLPAEVCFKRKDGRLLFAEAKPAIIAIDGRKYVLLNLRDITERKQAETILQESNAMFETIFNAAGDGMYLRDLRDGRLHLANRSCLAMLGYTMEEFRQLDMPDLVSEEDLPFIRAQFEKFRHDGIGRGGEISLMRKDGSRLPVDIKSSAMTLGKQKYVLVNVRDITERKRAEAILQESNTRFQAIFDVAADGMYLRDLRDGHYHLANKACLEMLGYTLEEFRTLTPADLFAEEDLTFVQERLQQFRLSKVGIQCEIGFKRKDGRILQIEANSSSIIVEDQQYLLVVIRDITMRKQAEAQLLVYQEQLQALTAQNTIVSHQIRQRIAGELHDQVAQVLALAKIQLDAHEEKTSDTDAISTIQDIGQLIQQSLDAVRGLSFELCPPVLLERGLGAGIRWLATELQTRHHLNISVKEQARLALTHKWSIILYWPVRELLMNVVKHAYARTASVTIKEVHGILRITVVDDGNGFTPDMLVVPIRPGQGFGLFNIRERMLELGGQLDIKSAPGKGTQVCMRLPMRNLALLEQNGNSCI